ncbi:MAG: type II secretion system protein [Planctomycetota bacterium]
MTVRSDLSAPLAGQRGFTLIELLIVIAIIGTLAAVLLPRVLDTRGAADQAATEARMLQLKNAIEKFERVNGTYPSDDLKYLRANKKPTWKADNGKNTGIESLVVMLSQNKKDGTSLADLGDALINTDEDSHGEALPLLDGMRGRYEVADGWGTPMAYFSKLNIDKPQQVVPAVGEAAVTVKAKKREDGSYYGQRKFQLLSAGPDLDFGTDDDVVWPSN